MKTRRGFWTLFATTIAMGLGHALLALVLIGIAASLTGCGATNWGPVPEGLTSREHGYPGAAAPALPSWSADPSSMPRWQPYDCHGWVNWPSITSHRRRNSVPCLDAIVDSPNATVRIALREWYRHGMTRGEIRYAEVTRPEVGRAIWGMRGRAAALPPLW